jgi:hypothetical protein
MQVGDVIPTGKLLELLDGADADDLLVVLADPERDWSTPVSIP